MAIIGLPAFKDNYIWGIVNETNHTLTCVDPGAAKPVLDYAHRNGLTLNNILITHHHTDHIGGTAELLQAYPKMNVFGPRDPRIPQINHVLGDEELVHIDHLAFRVLKTPGHTSTHICYQEPTQGWLFCGDTLFSAGCGRIFDGTIEQLHQSILLLKNLSEDTQIYCGHEYTLQNLRFAASVEPKNEAVRAHYKQLQEKKDGCSLPSTIRLEKKINPFMRTNASSIQAFATAHGIPSHDSLAVFNLLRERKNHFN